MVRHLSILPALVLGAMPGWTLAAECTPSVTIETPWARATPPGATVGAVYLQIAGSCAADTLIAAESPVAARVELHNMFRVDGRMQMRAVPQIPVAANGRVSLQPGGLHIMLLDIRQPLREGERVDLTLVFEKAGRVPVAATVAAMGAPMAPAAPAAHPVPVTPPTQRSNATR